MIPDPKRPFQTFILVLLFLFHPGFNVTYIFYLVYNHNISLERSFETIFEFQIILVIHPVESGKEYKTLYTTYISNNKTRRKRKKYDSITILQDVSP